MDAPTADDIREEPADEAEDGPETGTRQDSPAPRPDTGTAAVVEPILIAVGLVLLAFTPKPAMQGDGLARYWGLVELLERQQLSEMPYSLIGPLFAAPLWLVGRWYGDPQLVVGHYNVLLFALSLVAIHLLLRRRMDPRLLRRFVLFLIAGSMIAAHVQDFYGEVFTTTTVGVGLLAATLPGTSRPTRLAGWIGVVLGIANTPVTVVAIGLVVGVLCLRTRRARYLSVPLAAAVLILGEAWLRFGDPLHGSYANSSGGPTVMPYSGAPGFSYPFLLGVVAILFSFGKGLLWFTPGLFLPARRRLWEESGPAGAGVRSVWLLWTVFVAGLVLVYASWWSWYGGMYWGPRFFLFAILPAGLALAVCQRSERARAWTHLATLAAVALSVWGAANSLVYGQLRPLICYQDNWRLEALCHFTPEFSPLWVPIMESAALTRTQLCTLAYYALVLLWLVGPPLGRIVRRTGVEVRAQRHRLAWRDWRW